MKDNFLAFFFSFFSLAIFPKFCFIFPNLNLFFRFRYSRAKRCNNEGRAVMSLDLKVLLHSLEGIIPASAAPLSSSARINPASAAYPVITSRNLNDRNLRNQYFCVLSFLFFFCSTVWRALYQPIIIKFLKFAKFLNFTYFSKISCYFHVDFFNVFYLCIYFKGADFY
jgi:hypothetical protein